MPSDSSGTQRRPDRLGRELRPDRCSYFDGAGVRINVELFPHLDNHELRMPRAADIAVDEEPLLSTPTCQGHGRLTVRSFASSVQTNSSLRVFNLIPRIADSFVSICG